LYYPTTGFNAHMFRTKELNNTFLITNCIVYHNSTASSYTIEHIVYSDRGVVSFTNVAFRDLVFTNYGSIRFDYPGTTCTYSYIICTFHSILQKGNYPAALYSSQPLNGVVCNISFINITHQQSVSYSGVMRWPLDPLGAVSDLYFANITAAKSALRFINVTSCILRNIQFCNVTASDSSGAGCHVRGDSSVTVTFSECYFFMCTASSSGGISSSPSSIFLFYFIFFFDLC
jgi:hypothetical protein